VTRRPALVIVGILLLSPTKATLVTGSITTADRTVTGALNIHSMQPVLASSEYTAPSCVRAKTRPA
jgi:hypothetical protein